MAGAGQSDDRRAAVVEWLAATIGLHQRVMGMASDSVVSAVEAITHSLGRGGKLLAFGNGGSAADAQHLSAELVGRFLRERAALPAIALSADTSVMTAVANDYGYGHVFARQVEALGRAGDVVFAISTSGNSENVVAGIEAAKALGLTSVALTGGDGGRIGAASDIHINVPDASVPHVQEVHRSVIHVICDLVERAAEGQNR